MALKPGYKQTEVGVIPEDWDVTSMGELFTFQNGVNADKAAYGKGMPFINVLEVITHSTLTLNRIPGRISLSPQTTNIFKVQSGDVLFNRTSETQEEVGLSSVYKDDQEVVFGGFVIRARPRDNSLTSSFSCYALRSSSIRKQIISRGQGAVRANIGQQELSKVQAFVPPLPEQEAIAAALSDADALIESLEQLIAKKRQIKQGAMQELLTGKRRLPGFADGTTGYKQTEVGVIPEDWEVKQISDMNPFVTSGSRGWAAFYSNQGASFIRITNLSRNTIYLDLEDLRLVNLPKDACEGDRTQLQECDVLISITADIGIIGYVTSDFPKPAYINQHIALVRFDLSDTNPQFVSYFLASEKPQKRFRALTDSGAKAGMSLITVKKMHLALPPTKAEQDAIAKVLSDMDTEIAALETKLAKARQIKQGMMNNLLTGKIRLV